MGELSLFQRLEKVSGWIILVQRGFNECLIFPA
jgi:hypothetical protein